MHIICYKSSSLTAVVINYMLIFITLVNANLNADLSKTQRSSYGESCNKTVRCKSQSWLSCDQETNICQCAKVDEMIYDKKKEKCIALIGERCKYGFDEEDRGSNLWYERADCVSGAVCGPSGVCSCPAGFFEGINQCSPVKDYGQICLNREECNQDKFLNCIGGKCQCDLDNAIYNAESFYDNRNPYSNTIPGGICIGRVGTTCSYHAGKHCIRNSLCQENSGKCECLSEFSETSDRLCGLGHNQLCTETSICSDKLTCISGQLKSYRNSPFTSYTVEIRCQCPYTEYQEYDSTSKTCRGLTGTPCRPNDSYSCTPAAICVEKDNIFKCECKDGHVETAGGNCEIGYGSTCNYVNGHEILISELCDRLANLKCKERKCSCANEGDIYEPEKRQCSSPVGVRCKETTKCVTRSFCKNEVNKTIWGRCVCEDGYEVVRNHTCVPVRLSPSVDLANENNTDQTESLELVELLGIFDEHLVEVNKTEV